MYCRYTISEEDKVIEVINLINVNFVHLKYLYNINLTNFYMI